MNQPKKYTCYDYRRERQLLGLRLQLNNEALTEEERTRLREDIEALEAEIGIS